PSPGSRAASSSADAWDRRVPPQAREFFRPNTEGSRAFAVNSTSRPGLTSPDRLARRAARFGLTAGGRYPIFSHPSDRPAQFPSTLARHPTTDPPLAGG